MSVATVTARARTSAFESFQPIDFTPPPAMAPRVLGAAGEDRLVVLYDRDCGICSATARLLLRWDRRHRLGLLPLQEARESDRPRIAEAGRELPLSAAIHVVDERTGAVHAAGDAVLAIVAELPGGGVVRPFAAIPPFRWVVGVGYALIARNRHRVGRWLRLEGPICDVPR